MLLEDGDELSLHDKFLILSLECAVEFAMGGILLEHVDHVVEVYEGVTDGNSIHFARVESSPSDQAANMIKSIYSNLHRCVSGMWLALHQKILMSVEWVRSKGLLLLTLKLGFLFRIVEF